MSCRKRCTTSSQQIYWLTGRTVKSNQDQWKDDDEDTRRLLNVDLEIEWVPCVLGRVGKWLCKWTCQKNVKQQEPVPFSFWMEGSPSSNHDHFSTQLLLHFSPFVNKSGEGFRGWEAWLQLVFFCGQSRQWIYLLFVCLFGKRKKFWINCGVRYKTTFGFGKGSNEDNRLRKQLKYNLCI